MTFRCSAAWQLVFKFLSTPVMISRSLVIAVLTLIVVACGVFQPKLTAEGYFKRGVERHAENDLKGALAAFNQAVEANARYAEAYRERGSVKYDQQDYTGAAADYDQALALNPRDAESFFQRGLVWSVLEEHYFKRKMDRERREHLDRAIVDFTKAVEIDGEHAKAYGARGIALLIQGRENDGNQDLAFAIKLNPDLEELLDSRVKEVVEQRFEKK